MIVYIGFWPLFKCSLHLLLEITTSNFVIFFRYIWFLVTLALLTTALVSFLTLLQILLFSVHSASSSTNSSNHQELFSPTVGETKSPLTESSILADYTTDLINEYSSKLELDYETDPNFFNPRSEALIASPADLTKADLDSTSTASESSNTVSTSSSLSSSTLDDVTITPGWSSSTTELFVVTSQNTLMMSIPSSSETYIDVEERDPNEG